MQICVVISKRKCQKSPVQINSNSLLCVDADTTGRSGYGCSAARQWARGFSCCSEACDMKPTSNIPVSSQPTKVIPWDCRNLDNS